MVNHYALCRSIKYNYINILTWTILKKIQILHGCETFAFKYIYIYYSQNLNLTIIFYRCHLYTSFKVPWVGLQCVIVVHVFPDHTHLLFHMLLVFSCYVFVVVFYTISWRVIME